VASISRSKASGLYRVLFIHPADGRRRAIRLGHASKRDAETVRAHVAHLVSAALMHQAPPDETAKWLAGVPDVLRERLTAIGLAGGRGPAQAAPPTLGAFLGGYLTGRTDLRASTHVALGQTVRYLTEFLGEAKALRDITPADADAFRIFLQVDRHLAPATVNRRCAVAKQFGRAAVRKGLLPSNPFSDLRAGNLANPARAFYVDAGTAQKVLDACPSVQWRMIFGLARFAGLRCPSEILGLRWADVNWAEGRFTVASPKTARHVGHESRQVPIVPELLPVLREGFEAAAEGADFVITNRRSNANLATELKRILWKAGIDPWPRLFQNLRASFATDLAARYPAHLAAKWLGHTPLIAAKHYWQATDADFATASVTPLFASAPGVTSEATRAGEQATQKATQTGAARCCQALTGQPGREDETAFVSTGQRQAAEGSDVSTHLVGATGLEPVTSWV